jgi:hypothetical protein
MRLYITAAYFTGALIASGLLSAANVYLLGNFDAKFQNDLGAALQLELLGDLLSSFMGSAILLLALFALRYQNQARTKMLMAGGFGAGQSILLYVVLVLLLADPQTESVLPAIAGWAIIIGWPVLAAFVFKGRSYPESLP